MPLGDHLHRRRQGHPRVPRLPDRAAGRAVDLPRGRLPADPRRAADARPQLDEWTHEITIHTFVHENVKEFMQGFRYDAHPMGMLLASVGALSTFYPEASAIKDEEVALHPDHPADREDADAGGVRVPPQPRACRTSIRTTTCRYPGNFLSMIYKMTELKYEPDPRLEHALDVLFILHADHEQNCSTSAVRERRLLAGRPVLGGRGRRGRALRPAARRRQRGGAADAAPDRDQGEHPRLHQGREGRQRAPDGLRPPGLQELRPAREDHQEGRRRGVRGHRARTRCSTSRSSSRRSRSRTTTSSSASSTRTSTSTRA